MVVDLFGCEFRHLMGSGLFVGREEYIHQAGSSNRWLIMRGETKRKSYQNEDVALFLMYDKQFGDKLFINNVSLFCL